MSDSDRGGESRPSSPGPVQPVHDTARERHAAFWNEFIASLAMDDPRRGATPDAFSFGGEGALAHELAALVLAGRKKATTSLPIEYTALDEPLPRAGDLSIVRCLRATRRVVRRCHPGSVPALSRRLASTVCERCRLALARRCGRTA